MFMPLRIQLFNIFLAKTYIVKQCGIFLSNLMQSTTTISTTIFRNLHNDRPSMRLQILDLIHGIKLIDSIVDMLEI